MNVLEAVCDDFPDSYGATADAAMRDVLRAVLSTAEERLGDQIRAGTAPVDALHVACYQTLRDVGREIGIEFDLSMIAATALAVVDRTLAHGAR